MRLSRFLFVLLLLCGILIGCRPSTTPGESHPTLTWMLPADNERPMYEEIIRAFQAAHPEITLKPLWVNKGQYQIKLKTLIAAKQAPDLFVCGDVWVAYLRPFLLDITDYVQRDAAEIDLDDFYPEVRAASQYDGRYYFLPHWYNVSLLYYNKTLFRENGVPYPTATWTWDDYVKAGQRLTYTQIETKDGRVLKVPYGEKIPVPEAQITKTTRIWGSGITTGWWGEWLIYVRQAGGDMFDPAMTRCTLDTPEAITGLQFYHDRITKYHIVPPNGYGPPNGFGSGQLAMLMGGHVATWTTFNKLQDLDWDIQVMPAGPKSRRGGELAMQAWGISKTCRYPDAAWTLMKFLTSKAEIRRLVDTGHLSVRKSVQPTVLAHPQNLQAAYAAMRDGMRIPQSPDYIEVALDLIQPEVDLMLQDDQTPQQAGKKAATSATAFIKVLGRVR